MPILGAGAWMGSQPVGGCALQRDGLGNRLNNAGEATGYFYPPGIYEHAFLYSNGSIMDLGTLGGAVSQGNAINNTGQVTGVAFGPNFSHAFLYKNGQMIDLTPSTDQSSEAYVINDHGQVVGNYSANCTATFGGPHAFLYSNGYN